MTDQRRCRYSDSPFDETGGCLTLLLQYDGFAISPIPTKPLVQAIQDSTILSAERSDDTLTVKLCSEEWSRRELQLLNPDHAEYADPAFRVRHPKTFSFTLSRVSDRWVLSGFQRENAFTEEGKPKHWSRIRAEGWTEIAGAVLPKKVVREVVHRRADGSDGVARWEWVRLQEEVLPPTTALPSPFVEGWSVEELATGTRYVVGSREIWVKGQRYRLKEPLILPPGGRLAELLAEAQAMPEDEGAPAPPVGSGPVP